MLEAAALSREYFSAAELAALALPSYPASRTGWCNIAARLGWDRSDKVRVRAGRGGGYEYHYTLVPEPVRLAIVARFGVRVQPERADGRPDATDRAALWAWFEMQTEVRRSEGKRRVAALARLEMLVPECGGMSAALDMVAGEFGVGVSTISDWRDRVRGVARPDWVAALTPQARGGARAKVTLDERVWQAFKADYLRLSEPSFESAYRRTARIAADMDWTMPNARTLRRRVGELDLAMVTLMRKGVDALKRMYPAQERDRSMFQALQAVNVDGHKWDVFVKWPDGKIGRPLTVAWQDLYSGKFLAWRTDRSENQDCVRLAFGDMIAKFGIPDDAYLDNGRAFASKKITGGTANRYRFKVREEEPAGVITQLGVRVHWTTPYAGQSKPIERGFGDFASDIARGPAFDGAYTGNTPLAKPENYASKAIPIAEFRAIIDREIAAHNARPGRLAKNCRGRSFDETFNESYAASLIRRATAEQARLCLLAAEQVLVRKLDGAIHLFGNRYFNEALWQHRGERVTVRFDPDALHDDVMVQALDGAPICAAQVIEAAGFADTDAARVHSQARGSFIKATRALRDAEAMLSLTDLAKLHDVAAPAVPVPQPAAVRPFRPAVRGNLALQPEFEPEHSAQIMDFDERLRAGLARHRAAEDGL